MPSLPHRLARPFDIFFVIAFALQAAVWARELILGVIGRKIAEENGAGTLGNAMAIIRLLVSVTLFAIAGVLILENLNVNVTALVAGLEIGGIAIGLAAQGIFATCSRLSRSCSIGLSGEAIRSATTTAPERSNASGSRPRVFARLPASS